MSDPDRPSGVPEAAWWSAKDNEWIWGDKNGEGQLVGEVTYWRPDGSLVCKSDHVAGKPHGIARRFHETGEISQHCHYVNGELHGLRAWFMTDGVTTEKPRADGIAKNVWRGELDYENGRVIAFRFFDRDGAPVGTDGKLLPQRPPGVPANAILNKAGNWSAGTWNEKGKQIGLQRFWSKTGALVTEQDHIDGKVLITEYRDDGTLRARYTQTEDTKTLVGDAAGFARDGTQRLRATFGDTTIVEHLGVGGISVRVGTYSSATEVTPSSAAEPSDEDRLILDAIDEGDDSAVAAAEALSPAGMAHAIARGWGGDDDRDAVIARELRRLVRKVAPASLSERLAREHLDRVPRLQTPLRVTAVLDGLAGDPALDDGALRDALIEAGGPSRMLALADPDRAVAYLRSRISADGDTLQLAHLGLTELPPSIGRFHQIPRLYGEGNRLTTVPDEIGDMFHLGWLNLANNRITSLPRSLAWLPRLRTLYLSNNALTAIPSTVLELQDLGTLSIGDNELTEVPAAIGDMRSLYDLSLYDNQLRDLPASLAKCPLTFLHLGDHDWAEPPAVLGECKKLETLWLASRALKRLPAEIVTLPNLRELMVWYSDLTEIPDELYEAKQLRELRIKNNPLPDEVYARLAEALPDCKIY